MTAPLIVAHRGASAEAPENTLAAFEVARLEGAAMIELDVQMSADGVALVFHDDRLERCTNLAAVFPERRTEALFQFTAAELRQLDAGPGYEGRGANAGTKIPRLDEVLDWARSCGMQVNIELKNLPRLYPDLAPRVIELCRHCAMNDAVLISSFDHMLLRELKRAAPALRCSMLSAERLADMARYAREFLGVEGISPGGHLLGGLSVARSRGQELDHKILDEAAAAGLEVWVWTINDEQSFRLLRELGVTGVITDHPGRARQLYQAG